MNFEFTIIRHGKTRSNIMGIYAGVIDDPLCLEGVAGLASTYNKIKELKPLEMLFSSPMKRCLETSAIVFPDTKPIVIKELREIDFGIFEGKTYEELKNNPDFVRFSESGMTLPVPDGEHPKDFTSRCIKGLQTATSYLRDEGLQRGAIVCHGGVIMSLFSTLGSGSKSFYDFYVDNGCGFEAEFDPEENILNILRKI